MNPSVPLLSIVVTGRNDNHNGDFNTRAEYATRHNAALLKKYGIRYEYVWVEWNPLLDRPPFGETVRTWVENFRGYVVPPAIHNHLCDNPRIGVMQFYGKNVGIRRATGNWILSMNADTYLTNEVVGKLTQTPLSSNTFYLATRIDFPCQILQTPPTTYPIADVSERPAVRVDEIRLPDAYGSAGDFTLLHRDKFSRLGAHYEGIRFSNHHLDTLLGHQHRAAGGTFEVLGRVLHADHADSWNNFAAGDDKKHHGGCNYNCRKISIPYRNPTTWGLGNYLEKELSAGLRELVPPADLQLRPHLPEDVLIPRELDDIARFADDFAEAVAVIKERNLRVVIYGLGDQAKRLLAREGRGLKIVGYIDDNMKQAADFPHQLLTWNDARTAGFDVVLIASFFWADVLAQKARLHVPSDKILPHSRP
jgi:hypothetical protein